MLVELSKSDIPEIKIRKTHGPHDMHNPSVAGVQSSFSKTYNQHNILFRPAFHSYLEPTEGVMNYGEIVLGQIAFGVLESNNKSEFNLNHASWIKVSDHSPLLTYKWPVSWEFGLTSIRPLYDQSVLEHQLKLATGVSFRLGPSSFLYLMNFYRLALRGVGEAEKFQHEEGLKLGFRLKFLEDLYINLYGEGFLRNGFKNEFITTVNYGLQVDLQFRVNSRISLKAGYRSRFKEEAFNTGAVINF